MFRIFFAIIQFSYILNLQRFEIDGLPTNIIFSISRNDNNSVYYERNDGSGARVRICDNHTARIGYRGYYKRMTSDIGFVFGGIVSVSELQLPASIILEKTDIEEEQIKNSKSFLSLELENQRFSN